MGILLAATLSSSFIGPCLIEVDKIAYLDEPCRIEVQPDGNVTIGVGDDDGSLYLAYVKVTGFGKAIGYWNGFMNSKGSDELTRHAHTSLGNLTSQGACWFNDHAKVCAGWRGASESASAADGGDNGCDEFLAGDSGQPYVELDPSPMKQVRTAYLHEQWCSVEDHRLRTGRNIRSYLEEPAETSAPVRRMLTGGTSTDSSVANAYASASREDAALTGMVLPFVRPETVP